MLKFYKVTFGFDNRGEYTQRVDICNVLATDAISAIKKAAKTQPKGRIPDEVELVGVVDER